MERNSVFSEKHSCSLLEINFPFFFFFKEPDLRLKKRDRVDTDKNLF